jgi:hypothetical protein
MPTEINLEKEWAYIKTCASCVYFGGSKINTPCKQCLIMPFHICSEKVQNYFAKR